VRAFLEWFEKFENSIDAADSWFETSGQGHLAYIDCPGELLNKWHSGGYFSALKMLIVIIFIHYKIFRLTFKILGANKERRRVQQKSGFKLRSFQN